jgi:hypothetical protein
VPIAAGVIIGIGDTSLKFTDNFSLSGIALGTIVTIVCYHGARWIAPAYLKGSPSNPDAPPEVSADIDGVAT